jgi:hypothetical protein
MGKNASVDALIGEMASTMMITTIGIHLTKIRCNAFGDICKHLANTHYLKNDINM